MGGAVLAVVLGAVVTLQAVGAVGRSVSAVQAVLLVAGLAAVVVLTVLTLARRADAARLAPWFAVPLLLLGTAWWLPRPSSFGWFAYAPLSMVVVDGSATTDVALPALVVLLWVLATLGAVWRVPDPSRVRVLAVVAMALTVPLWVPPAARVASTGALLVTPALDGQGADGPVVAVRTAALLLTVAVGAAVLAAHPPAPARAAAYALPAAALTWVWWQTAGGGRIGAVSVGAATGPSAVDLLPWTVAAVAQTALVLVLWFLAVIGVRQLADRYRPPAAELS